MMNKLLLAVSTTVILTAANALMGWITRKLESPENSKGDEEKNPKCANT